MASVLMDELSLTSDGLQLALPRPKAGISIPTVTNSGNPWHDPGSGTFSKGPPGVKLKAGAELLDGLTNVGKVYVTQIKNRVSADTIEASQVAGNRIAIRFYSKGVLVHTATLPAGGSGTSPAPKDDPTNPGAKVAPDTSPTVAPADPGRAARDKAVDEARAESAEALKGAARIQRVDDIVDYYYGRFTTTGALDSGRVSKVRIEAPKGWDIKTLNALTDDEVRSIAVRLQAKGWTDEAIQTVLLGNIASGRRQGIKDKL